ncbi:TonB-dependent receptor [Pedobacter sp. ASV28]|uniref:TonB-dependent receptor n=1 Tax=Pedobacter sp. ASV28 TaxID=2795123 RepID=UPI0018ECCC1B|nr:TonB-dependent receptor [Pedobacter sp. ASV28]
MRRILLIILAVFALYHQVRAQRLLKTTAVISGFYTLPLTDMLDTLARKSNIRFIYDMEMIAPLQVTDQYHEEPVKNILASICKANNLHYWVESEQAIYLIRSTEDLPRLKKMMHDLHPNIAYAPKVSKVTSQKDNKVIFVAIAPSPSESNAVKKTVPFTISGRIIDQVSGESLPSALVKIEDHNLTTQTNSDGYFTLFNVPSDTCRIIINYVGYLQETYYLNTENIKKPLLIGLFTAVKSLNEVVVKGKKGESLMNMDKRKVSILQISPSKLDELPNVGERDILRSFQLMPGISGSNESSSGAYVRGGTPDQNLVLFDGFTVYQVDHLYGFFSAFNSNSVKDVTMYKGGFSSKFGGRLSSVTDIVGKEGNNNTANFGGDISLLSANLYYEKPINNKSTLLLAYRRSYEGPLYNKIFNKFNTSTISLGNGAPGMGNRPGGGGGPGGFEQNVSTPASAFYDLNAKYTYAPDEKNRFSWSLYQGNDNLDNSKTITVPSFITSNGGEITNTDKTTYGNLGSSFKWSRKWNPKIYSNTLLSFSTYHSDRDNSNLLTLVDTAGNESEVRNGTFEKNKLSDLSLKSDWEWQLKDKAKVLFGVFGSYQDVNYDFSESDTSKLIDQHTKAGIGGAYAEIELNPNDKLQIKPGIRSSFYSETGKLYFEPRLSGSYTLTDQLTLKASTGKFYQFTNRVIREDILSGSRDFWVLANGSAIPVSSANHYILGMSYETDNFLFDVESYYKTLSNLAEYSQRQTGNRRTGITLEEHFYTGNGYTKGIEFLVQKTRGKYTGWISYTLAKAINNFEAYGGEFAASHDTRHEFKSVNLYHYGRWSFAATWIFATGKPYTAPLSSYTINDYSGNSHTYLTISNKNALRLPSYHRLDLSATYDLLKIDSRKVGSIGFSVFNAYNRGNVWYQQYTIVNNQVITSNVNYLGLTPNITLSLKWK